MGTSDRNKIVTEVEKLDEGSCYWSRRYNEAKSIWKLFSIEETYGKTRAFENSRGLW